MLYFNPDFLGLAKLEVFPSVELEVNIEAEQWYWNVSYPQYGVTIDEAKEMLLPIGRRVHVELTSKDVIHSFWVPAFRLKRDAVPGQVNSLYMTPTLIGRYDYDFMYRAPQNADAAGCCRTSRV